MGRGVLKLSLDILFEDRHCIAVAKPARLLTASDETKDQTLLELVRAHNASKQAEGRKGYLVPIHFLDRPVSGVVVFAASSKAAERLNKQFRERGVTKIYYAIVETTRTVEPGTVDSYLLKDRDTNIVKTVDAKTPGAKHCLLSYRALCQGRNHALLEVKPETGRSHQIRVQLSSRGLPIFGDKKYGAASSWEGAIALHAKSLSFVHPVEKTPVVIEAPLPPAWEELLQRHGLVVRERP